MEMKERIQEKSRELFDRYGIKSVTMDDIASNLGISKKTIYQSFADKDALVDAVFNLQMTQNKEQCLHDQQIAENAVHEIFLAMDMISELLACMHQNILYDLEKYHPAVFKKFIQYKTDFIGKIIVNNLTKGKAEGLYRQELNVDIITKMRLYTMMLSFNPELYPGSKYNLLEVEYEIIYHFLYGISTAKGIKLIEKYKQKRN